jgi:hypothetical protein
MASRLSMAGRLALTLFAVLALGGLVASAAQAEGPTEPLRWRVEGHILGPNETREITVTKWNANPPTREPITFVGGNLRIQCEVVKAGPNPYLANQANGAVEISSPEFQQCTTTGNGAGCTVNEPIRSKQNRGEPVLNDNLPGIGKRVLGRSTPLTGRVFARMEFVGAGCTINPIEVTGIASASSFSDPLAFGGTTSEPLEIEGTAGAHNNAETEAKSARLSLTGEAKSVYLWSVTEFKLFEIPKAEEFKAGSEPAAIYGNVLTVLARNGIPTGENASLVK